MAKFGSKLMDAREWATKCRKIHGFFYVVVGWFLQIYRTFRYYSAYKKRTENENETKTIRPHTNQWRVKMQVAI